MKQGMDTRTSDMLKMVFEKHAQAAFILVEETQAEACIFDMDTLGSKALWEIYQQQHPAMPTLVLSLYDWVGKKHLFIKKPVKLTILLEQLTLLKQQVEQFRLTLTELIPASQTETQTKAGTASPKKQTQDVKHTTQTLEQYQQHYFSQYADNRICGEHPDINLKDRKAVASISYHANEYFQGLFSKAMHLAKQQQCCIHIQGFFGELLIHPAKNRLLSSVQEERLFTMATMPIKAEHVKMLTVPPEELEQQIKTASVAFYHYYLEQFTWKLSLWTARGRIMADTPLDQAIVLSRWPNFTRLLIPPHAMQITALWIETACSLAETARLLEIPQRDVFTFYNAVYAIGLAYPDHQTKDHHKTLKLSAKHTEQRGLFRKILSHLGLKI